MINTYTILGKKKLTVDNKNKFRIIILEINIMYLASGVDILIGPTTRLKVQNILLESKYLVKRK